MWETQLRVLTKAWKYLTRDNSTFRECSPPPTRSSLKRFLNCGSKALNVLCWSEKPRVGFPPGLSEVFCTSIQILSTSSFASLNVTFFADVPFSRISKASYRYPRVLRNETAETVLLILEDELFVELSTTSFLTDAFCLSGTARHDIS